MPRPQIPAFAVAAALAIGAGCSKSEPEDTPAACLQGPARYLTALGAAPEEVRLADDTAISACLPAGQEGGDLAQVGSTMVAVATRLNEEAREDPRGPRAVELGYLVGAAERGAEDTSGIHQDLILRLNAAARFSPSGRSSPAFRRTFARGYRTGRESG